MTISVRVLPYLLSAIACSAVACSDATSSGTGNDAGTPDAATDSSISTDAALDSSVPDASEMDASPSTDAATDAHTEAQPDAPASDASLGDASADASSSIDMGGDDAGTVAGPCAAISDDTLRTIVYEGPRVPAGFYYEEPADFQMFQWRTPCSDSLETTTSRAAALFGADSLVSSAAYDKFFQTDALPVDTGGYHVLFRNTRCDYFDGTTLAGAPHDSYDALGNLVSYLWFTENHDLTGSAIVSGEGACHGDGCDYYLCAVQTVFGDFGLCDQITLTQQHYGISTAGSVRFAEPVEVRTIDGTCHP